MTFFISLPNFPEWAIPMTKVIPIAYTEDGYNLSTVTWTVQCQHLWRIKPSTNPNNPNVVELRIDCTATATIPGPTGKPQYIPCYVDIDMIFYNDRVAQQVNPKKS